MPIMKIMLNKNLLRLGSVKQFVIYLWSLLTSCLFLSASLAGVLEELSSFGDVVFLLS